MSAISPSPVAQPSSVSRGKEKVIEAPLDRNYETLFNPSDVGERGHAVQSSETARARPAGR
jgi:hypothetical protein